MSESYKCVNCGEGASALFRTYAPTVLKLTKCNNCKGLVDKYIEYDPVIVMIDLVLMSKEAQRHILYNTEFKSFWKLLIIFIMLETYGVWRNDSLFNIAINTLCGFKTNATLTYLYTPSNTSLLDPWRTNCWAWTIEDKAEDLFIWEKDFYIHFCSTCFAIILFLVAVKILMTLATSQSKNISKVTCIQVLKAFSLAHVSTLFTLPMLVWGAETNVETKTIHYLLVFGYSLAVFVNVFTVLYECPVLITIVVILICHSMKYLANFTITPIIRGFSA